jgi:hypothetical protein
MRLDISEARADVCIGRKRARVCDGDVDTRARRRRRVVASTTDAATASDISSLLLCKPETIDDIVAPTVSSVGQLCEWRRCGCPQLCGGTNSTLRGLAYFSGIAPGVSIGYVPGLELWGVDNKGVRLWRQPLRVFLHALSAVAWFHHDAGMGTCILRNTDLLAVTYNGVVINGPYAVCVNRKSSAGRIAQRTTFGNSKGLFEFGLRRSRSTTKVRDWGLQGAAYHMPVETLRGIMAGDTANIIVFMEWMMLLFGWFSSVYGCSLSLMDVATTASAHCAFTASLSLQQLVRVHSLLPCVWHDEAAGDTVVDRYKILLRVVTRNNPTKVDMCDDGKSSRGLPLYAVGRAGEEVITRQPVDLWSPRGSTLRPPPRGHALLLLLFRAWSNAYVFETSATRATTPLYTCSLRVAVRFPDATGAFLARLMAASEKSCDDGAMQRDGPLSVGSGEGMTGAAWELPVHLQKVAFVDLTSGALGAAPRVPSRGMVDWVTYTTDGAPLSYGTQQYNTRERCNCRIEAPVRDSPTAPDDVSLVFGMGRGPTTGDGMVLNSLHVYMGVSRALQWIYTG